MVDEAHATGVLGPGGRGRVAAAGLEGEVDVIVGTLGKALGGYGAYVCCDAEMARYLVNTARTLIFSTGPPPPSVAAALAALELLREQPRRDRAAAAQRAHVLRDALAEEGFQVSDGRDADRAAGARATPRWRWTSASGRCAGACSRRRSGRRRCPTAARACGWRRWRPTRRPSCGGRPRSWRPPSQEAGAEPRALEPRRAELFVYDGEGLGEAPAERAA